METVFLTGGTGFIGKRLIKEMVQCKEIENIWALYRTEIPFENEKIRWVKGDMDHLPGLSKEERITMVVHCAALMAGSCPSKTLYESNIRWTEQIIKFCRKYQVKKLILFSSINVRLKHRGAYAESKIRCEELVRESEIPFGIIRPALVYGKGKNGITSLMNYIRKLPFVPVFGDGHAKEQPIHVNDLAKLTVRYVLDTEAPEVIELCGEEAMEYDEMVRRLSKQVGRKVRILHLPFLPFYYGLLILEKLNLVLPVSAEQVAHIAEDLESEMQEIFEKYQISMRSFGRSM